MSQNNCDHDVKTDPANPYNTALPTGPNSSKYLNGFNWFPTELSEDQGFGLYEDYPCTDIHFNNYNYPEMNNILLNPLSDYDYLSEGPLPLTKNGWELLLVNVGRFPDDVTPITSGNSFYGLPYIVIYNKYSGTIRVFVNFGPDKIAGLAVPDAFKISLKFDEDEKLSGLLRLNNGIDKTLDRTTDVKQVSTISKAPAAASHWASADFKVAYDPCTCYYPSRLKIDIMQMGSCNLTLDGRSVTLDDQALVNNTTLQVNPTEFLSGFNATTAANDGGGLVIEKTMEKMISNYLELYEKYNKDLVIANEHNKKVKTNLAILRMAKTAISFAVNPPAGLIQFTANMTEAEQKAQKESYAEYLAEVAAAGTMGMSSLEITEAYYGLGAFDEFQQSVDWFKTIKGLPDGIVTIGENGVNLFNNEALFSAVSKIFGEKGKTFIANNFVEKGMPTPPPMPTATFSEMKYVGTLSDDLHIGGPKFYTPGTYGSTGTGSPNITNVYEYPVYNEILGSFALLETPKLLLYESASEGQSWYYNQVEDRNQGDVYPYTAETYRYKYWKKNYEFKLKQHLKYVFNTALDIRSTNVQASFNIVATPVLTAVIPERSKYSVFNAPEFAANVSSNSADLSADFPFRTYGESYTGAFTGSDFDQTHFEPADLIPTVNAKPVSIQTPYLPVSAFFPMVSRFGLKNEFKSYEDQDINQDQYYNSDIFYGDQTAPFVLNMSSSVLTQRAKDFDVNNGLKYTFEAELKLIVDIEFNTVNQYGMTNKVTQVLTYKLDPSDIFYTGNALSNNNPINDVQYPFDLYLPATDFHGQQVTGCKLNGNQYVCQSLNNATITGNLTTTGNYFVYVKAGNEVYVNPEAQISPEIVMEINPVMDNSHPMPAATSVYLESFCKGTNPNAPSYKARSGTKALPASADEDSDSPLSGNNSEPQFDFNLFPNPTADLVKIEFDKDVTLIQLLITNISGKQLPVNMISSEPGYYSLDLQNFADGIYLVTVSTSKGTITKQIVKR